MTKRRALLTATLAAGTLLLGACGSDSGGGSTSTVVGGDAFNDADVEFAQGMIAHHEQAIEMAEMALDPEAGARSEVLDLATRIKGAQDPEIAQMKAWLNAWGKPPRMDESGGHDMDSMDGMMTADEMDDLANLTGPSFDTEWLDMMARHHEGAIKQAEDVKDGGTNPDLRALADQIITAQQGEIDEMQKLLGGSA